MNINDVRKMTLERLKAFDSQSKYAEAIYISRGNLNKFINKEIDYVPEAVLKDLGLKKCDVQYEYIKGKKL